MDGNTSQNEEDEFLEALKEEMPDVFNNIKSNFDQLDEFDSNVNSIQSSKDAEELLKAKATIEKLTQSVSDIEDLANKLEAEIIDWNLPDKLQRRDQEIETIQVQIHQALQSLDKEQNSMLDDLHSLKSRDDASSNKNDIKELGTYIENMNSLETKMENFKQSFEQLAEEWEKEIPQYIKNGRDTRSSPKK